MVVLGKSHIFVTAKTIKLIRYEEIPYGDDDNVHQLSCCFWNGDVIKWRTLHQKKDVVLSKKTSVDNNQRPRSPRKLVLDCYYEDGYVYLYTSFEIGVIDMTIRNLSTGEVLNYAQESGFGWISFPASTADGNYMVEMGTESYGDYIGYYEL